MVWNYRIVRQDGMYVLHEVYYSRNDGTKPYAMTKEPPEPMGETREGLIETLEMMLADAKKKRRVFVPPKEWDKPKPVSSRKRKGVKKNV